MGAPKYLSGDASAIADFLDRFDTFLVDCDGVLWSGEHVFDGIPETIQFLHSQASGSAPLTHPPGKRTIFVTNNSTKSRVEYHAKLTSKGIPCTVDDIFGSAYSAAVYIARILRLPPHRNKVFVLGEAGIEAELRSEGVPYIGGTDPAYRRLGMTPDDFAGIADGSHLDPAVGAVLAGLDFHVDYYKLAHAHAYLRGDHVRGNDDSNNANGETNQNNENTNRAVFLATNMDSTLPMYYSLFPGAGSATVVALAHMTGVEPLSLGKPSQAMLDAVEGRFSLDRARTCMIGDRLNTDIQFGVQGRLGGTLAVLTGVSSKADWEKPEAPAVPAYYVDSLSDLRGPAAK
ncbi:4-nitrophenylphosphatase [Niveomyces insectorum RCEF 264]|uniref:4-nitrophenylphosphatase n=1 Tax=Niveomyces insectorum RCEF 264 TaxID=1081102 RepID=A0A167RAF4_9HYPO|nr:4-nitrophenylphosphatase [Niveomyces insectorum RCEF 264]